MSVLPAIADRAEAEALELAQLACDLAIRIRDEDPAEVHRDLYGMGADRMVALVSVMAAMIPEDRSLGELLAWVEPLPPLRPWVPRRPA